MRNGNYVFSFHKIKQFESIFFVKMHFSMILFVLILIDPCLTYSEQTDSCVTFQTNGNDTRNMCVDVVGNETGSITTVLNCIIYETIRMKTDQCITEYSQVIFTFPNNSIFELFFKDYHETIQKLFRKGGSKELVPFHIVLFNHNLTKITWAYLNSTLKTGSQVYNSLLVDFQQTNPNASQPEIGNDFNHTNLLRITLSIPCTHGVGKNSYILEQNSETFNISSACKSSVYYLDEDR
jgi:hypothetical protein